MHPASFTIFVTVYTWAQVTQMYPSEIATFDNRSNIIKNASIAALTEYRLSLCSAQNQTCDAGVNSSCSVCSRRFCENDDSCCKTVRNNKCVRPQLFKFGIAPLNTRDSYMMTTSCNGENWNDVIKDNCSLGENAPMLPYMEQYRPVTSTATHQTYRNKYCAICNGENPQVLQEWSFELTCNDVQPNVYTSMYQFMTDILKKRNCNVYFKPIDTSHVTRCNWGLYTECNMTGNWTVFIKQVEDACNNYVELYDSLYKNVYCYICNTQYPEVYGCKDIYRDSITDFISSIGSFNALLNFQPLPDVVATVKKKCPGQSIYDGYKNLCREVQCSFPFVYKNDTCVETIYKMRDARYDLFLRFDKGSNFNSSQNYCFLTAGAFIYNHVRHLVKSLSFGSNLCHVTVLTKPLEFGYFRFLIVHVEILTLNYSHQVHSVASELLKSLSKLPRIYGRPNDCMDLHPQVLQGNFYNVSEESTLMNPVERSYTDPSDGKLLYVDPSMYFITSTRSIVCPEYRHVLQVAEVNLCPLLNVSMDEFNGTLNNGILCLNDIALCLTSDRYRYDSNTSVVQICSGTYLSQISKYIKKSQEPRTDKVERILSFFCSCLSMVCLVLTLITYFLFSSLRTLPGLNNMALSMCLLLAHGLYTFGMNATSHVITCTTLGIMIHFSWLCAVFMMNVTSMNMFRAFTHTKQKTHMTDKEKMISFSLGLLYCVIGSAVLLAITIVYNMVISDGQSIGYGGCTCFINNQKSQLYMFALPVGLIILSNIGMFITVVVQIQRLPDIRASSKHERQNLKIYAKLSTLTGMTWIFGFLQNIALEKMFAYIFIILNASQGIFIMVSFICNKRVYNLYRYKWKTRQNTNSNIRTTDSTLTRSKNGKSTSQTCATHSQSNGQDGYQSTRF